MKLFRKLFKRKSKIPGNTPEHDQNDQLNEKQIKSNDFIVSTTYFEPILKPNPISEISFIYCLIGNIVEERFSKSEQKVYKGTKHFSSGTKVYCFPPLWGDGYESIKVIGRHRNSARMVTMIIPSKHVTNWRVKAVYHPFIIKQMSRNAHIYNKESHKEDMLLLAASLNNR